MTSLLLLSRRRLSRWLSFYPPPFGIGRYTVMGEGMGEGRGDLSRCVPSRHPANESPALNSEGFGQGGRSGGGRSPFIRTKLARVRVRVRLRFRVMMRVWARVRVRMRVRMG